MMTGRRLRSGSSYRSDMTNRYSSRRGPERQPESLCPRALTANATGTQRYALPVASRPLVVGSVPGATGLGTIDYRLARQAVIAEYREGLLSLEDVCDAHPELRRAARSCSEATADRCPICEAAQVVHVTYVFGPRLPSHGRCVSTAAELTKLAQRRGTFTAYVVEVCPSCSWNHLAHIYELSDES